MTTMRMRHLSDDRLIDVCLTGELLPSDVAHLQRCDVCEGRRAELAGMLGEVSATLTAEADAQFTAERLEKQKAHVLHRLELEGRSARVITFPASQPVRPILRARPAGLRWIASAAAMGLIIGLLAGQLVYRLPLQGAGPANVANVTAEAPELRAISTTMSEEEFLGRLEVAIEGTGGASLRPLDDLTPRVWEVAAQ